MHFQSWVDRQFGRHVTDNSCCAGNLSEIHVLLWTSRIVAKFALDLEWLRYVYILGEWLLRLWRRGCAVTSGLCSADLMALSYSFAAFPLGTLWTVDAEKLAEVDAAPRDLFVKVTEFEVAVDHLATTISAHTRLTGLSHSIFLFLAFMSCSIFLAEVWH